MGIAAQELEGVANAVLGGRYNANSAIANSSSDIVLRFPTPIPVVHGDGGRRKVA